MTGLFAALGLALAATVGGASATYVVPAPMSLRCRLAMGAPLGLSVLGLAALAVGWRSGISTAVVIAAGIAAAAPALLFTLRAFRLALRADIAAAIRGLRACDPPSAGDRRATILAGVLWTILLAALFSQAIFQDGRGIHTGSYASRADLPFHVGIIANFTDARAFPPEHPEFAGARLTYPFLADLVAAVLRSAGATLSQALLIQNLLLALAIVTLLECVTFELTRDRKAALFAPPLAMFGATLGWMLVPGDLLRAGGSPWTFLNHLPHSYSLRTANLEWGNLATIFLVPQRSLLLGLPLVLTVIFLWWRAVAAASDWGSRGQSPSQAIRTMIAAGAVAGCLPLAHAHSFGVVMMTGAGLALLFRQWRAWTSFFIVASLVALPQVFALAQGSEARASSFVGWSPGWSQGAEPFFWFWFKNTGLFIPLLVAGLLMRPRDETQATLRLFYLPFILCLVVPNLFRLAPRLWDNNKVLIYWYVGSAPVVALLLARLWQRRMIGRLAAAALLASLTLSGLLDTWRVVTGVGGVTVFDQPSVDFADVLREKTGDRALLVRAPTVSHPVMLAGRRSLLGWSERVQSHGIDTSAREADERAVYEGKADPALLVQRYGADYLVIGPPERHWCDVDPRLSRLPLVARAGEYGLYDLRQAIAPSTASAR